MAISDCPYKTLDKIENVLYNKEHTWSDIEVVIPSHTGTVVVLYRARGFESHSLRQFK